MRDTEERESSEPELSATCGRFYRESESRTAAMARACAQDRGENTLPILQLSENTDPIIAREKLLQQRSEIVSSGISGFFE